MTYRMRQNGGKNKSLHEDNVECNYNVETHSMPFFMPDSLDRFDVYTQNFKYPKRQNPIEVYSSEPADHGNAKWRQIVMLPICS